MKRAFAIFFAVCTLFFAGCYTSQTSDVELTCAEVIAAYEDAGYDIFHRETEMDEDLEYHCYIEVTHDDLDGEMYIHFFDTHEEAVAYLDEAPYASIGIGLFSLIWGQPTWIRFKAYNQIALEYPKAEFYKPFKQLLKDKR